MYEGFSVWILIALAGAGIGLLFLCTVVFPKVIVGRRIGSSTNNFTIADRLKAENDVRTTLLQAVGGAALLLGAFFTWSQLQISQQSQITDRFSKAIEEMSNEHSSDTRLGGIYTLDQIARDSPKDRDTIIQILSSYIRAHSPFVVQRALSGNKDTSGAIKCPGTIDTKVLDGLEQMYRRAGDIQAASVALGRREHIGGVTQYALLQTVDLRKVFLPKVHLEYADLRGIHLEGADLEGAYLHRVRLDSWDCGSHLEYAYLNGADLSEAQLQDANFYGADLRGANLIGAKIDGAIFKGTIADSNTKWPTGFDPAKAGARIDGG